MSYQNWYDAMAVRYPSDEQMPEWVEACLNPDPSEFLAHQREQIRKGDPDDPRLWQLEKAVTDAETALESGEIARVATAWCKLGARVEAFAHPSSEKKLELYESALHGIQARESDLKRHRHTFEKKAFMETARQVAVELWAEDEDRQIKIGEMAHEVYSRMHEIEEDLGRKLLPDRPEQIREWLKEVAPSYARIGGRPRNKP